AGYPAIDSPPVPLRVDRHQHDDANASHAAGGALRIGGRHRPGRRGLLLPRDRVVLDVLRFAERPFVERHLDVGLDSARLLVEPEVLRQVLEDVLAILDSEVEAARISGEDALTKADPVVFGEVAAHHLVEAQLPPLRAARAHRKEILPVALPARLIEDNAARAGRVDLLVAGVRDLLPGRQEAV